MSFPFAQTPGSRPPMAPSYVVKPGGTPTQPKSGITAPLNRLTFQNPPMPQSSHNSSDGEADIAAHLGVSAAGGSDQQPSGIPSVPQFHQKPIFDPILDNFDDAPYVPPRITQAELQAYPALDPRLGKVYNPDVQLQFAYEGGTSPSGSHRSGTESNWSNSSPSTSIQQLPNDYVIEHASQYSRTPLPHRPTSYPQHYPAYHGTQRLGLEHVRYGEHPSNAGGSYYRNPGHGYMTDGVLSPEIYDDATAPVANTSQVNYSTNPSQGSSSSPPIPATNQPLNASSFSPSPTPTDNGRSLFPDAGPHLRQQLGLSAHEPIDLYSLPDPPSGEKPSTPLPILIKLAIYGSPNKQLTLQEIYMELENRFQWFKSHKHDKAWKNSIRHNLSLNKVFKHVPRPITEPGKGSYWQLDMSGGEGYKRPRKRRAKSKMAVSEEDDEEASEMDEDLPSPPDSSQRAGLGRSSATPFEDPYIDPELRSEGHVVGEGRTRSTLRTGSGSPYPSQSPRYQQGSLPVVAGQDTTAFGQPTVRFGQPSFGQGSFPNYPQTRPMPAASSGLSFAAMSSSPITMAPTTSTATRPQLQRVASYDRNAPISQPPPRSGIEYVMEPGGLPTARRVGTHSESEGQSQGNVGHSRSGSSSSGSSRTWNDARSRSQMDDQ